MAGRPTDTREVRVMSTVTARPLSTRTAAKPARITERSTEHENHPWEMHHGGSRPPPTPTGVGTVRAPDAD